MRLKRLINILSLLLLIALEAELLDGQSGERLGTLVDSLSETVSKKDKSSQESLEQAGTFYAKRFRSRMDAEH